MVENMLKASANPCIKFNMKSTIFIIPIVIVIGVLVYILSLIILGGLKALNLDLLFTSIMYGGIFEAIIGTFLLLVGTSILALPISIATAIYLTEYAPKGGKTVKIIEQSIDNLAGLPSIVVGLFGYEFFVKMLGFGVSLLSGWLTLLIMVIPIVTKATKEAILMVPEEFRKVASALGATKWDIIRDIILPISMPGIASGIILGMARISGETAAILFTACTLTARGIPATPLEPIISLSYYLFVVIFTSPGSAYTKAYALATILMSITVSLYSIAIIVRFHYRKRKRW